MRFAALVWLAMFGLACGGSPPPSGPSTPPARQAEEKGTSMADPARATPWSIVYADGAANSYRFAQASAGAPVTFEYVPVTPERSSTGSYSGGEPHAAELASDDARVAELWQRVERLEADAAAHAESRGKGTGAFTLTTPTGTRRFLIAQGATLDEFHGWVTGFRPQGG